MQAPMTHMIGSALQLVCQLAECLHIDSRCVASMWQIPPYPLIRVAGITHHSRTPCRAVNYVFHVLSSGRRCSHQSHFMFHMHLVCTVQAVEHGDGPSSGLDPEQWQKVTSHLSDAHCNFFSHWVGLVEVEEAGGREGKSALWAASGEQREAAGECLANLVYKVGAMCVICSWGWVTECWGKRGEWVGYWLVAADEEDVAG